MVHKVSVIGTPGTGKTRKFVEEIKDKLTEAVATSVTLAPIYEIAKRSGFEPKTLGLRTIYGLAESNLLKDGYLSSDLAKYLNPTYNLRLKRKVAKKIGLRFMGKDPFDLDIIETGTFETLTVLYTKAIFLKGDYDAVYEFLNEAERFGITSRHFDVIYKLYKEGKYYDYSFLILDAWKNQINIAKYKQGSDTIYFKYVYIDEAQDLGVIPYKLFELYEDQYDVFKLFGDPGQTIYQFLGAKPSIILNHGKREVLNPTWRFGKNIAELGNKILRKLHFPYKIEYTDKPDRVVVKSFSSEKLLLDLEAISNKAPDWSIAILTRTNSQANLIRRLISKKFAPLPIKDSQRELVDRVMTAIGNFIMFKKTGSREYFRRIKSYFGEETKGLMGYLDVQKYKNISIGEFLLRVEQKLFNRRLQWLEEVVIKLLKGFKEIYVDTIHSAKGLEFDVVIIYDEIPKLIRQFISENPKYLREEMFVYYTAITRARRLLKIYLRPVNYYEAIFC